MHICIYKYVYRYIGNIQIFCTHEGTLISIVTTVMGAKHSKRCNNLQPLQRTATHYNTLQQTTTKCNTLGDVSGRL